MEAQEICGLAPAASGCIVYCWRTLQRHSRRYRLGLPPDAAADERCDLEKRGRLGFEEERVHGMGSWEVLALFFSVNTANSALVWALEFFKIIYGSSGLILVKAAIVLPRRQMLVRSFPAFPWRHIGRNKKSRTRVWILGPGGPGGAGDVVQN